MGYLEFISSILGGAVGGAALASLAISKLLDHKLNSRLKVLDFLLQNRARVWGEILGAMGRTITAAREIALDEEYVPQHNESLTHAVVDLEDHLRPAYVLLDNDIYNQVHHYKMMARSLLRAYFSLKNSDTGGGGIQHEIKALVEKLESQRSAVLNTVGSQMAPLKRRWPKRI